MYYKKVSTSIKRIMLAFMLISGCLHTNVNAQDITTINLEKPGILKKVLKKLGKQEPLSVTHLKITGEINDKDIEILNQMSNLVYLDGSEMKGDYLDLSSFTKLEHLSLPCYTDNYDLLRGVINSHLKCLELPEYRGNIFKLFIDYKGDFIEKVYITDKQGILESRRLEEDRKFYGLKKGSNREYEQLYNRIKVDTLYVPNVKALYSWTTLHRFDPCYVVLQAENQIILNKWKQTETKKIVDLQGISLIMPYAFDGIDNIEKIIYPEYMEEIPDYAFYGCKNLKEVVLKNIKKTGRNIFENTKIKSITFPQTLEELDLCTFKKSVVDEVEFLGQYPPSMTGEGYWRNDLGGIKFQIPTKTLSSYQIGNWKNLVLVEKGENSTFEISLETPGTMEKHLSDEIIANA